jgi:hypothetical protein
MNPTINLISGFKKVKAEDGSEHHTGTLNLRALKKAGTSEIQVVLLSNEGLPKRLLDLMKKGGQVPDLLLFSETSPAKPTKGTGRAS